MFDVAGISTGVTASNSKSTAISDNSNLDQDAFLTLLVAELQYQDPLEPMENQEYISQLTGFSSLDELRSIGSALEDQQAAAATNLNAQSIGLIGREVTVIDESHQTIPQLNGMYHGDMARKHNLVDYGFRLPSAVDNRPLRFEEFEKVVKGEFGRKTGKGWYEYGE